MSDFSGKEPIEQVRVRVLPDGRMTRADAARYLGVSVQTLANWECLGKGPRSIRIGGRRFYTRAALDSLITAGVAA